MSFIVGQILLGWLLADLLSGILHWIEDRVLPEGIPLLDAQIVQPNRLHHAEPMHFTAGSFVSRNLTTWIAAAVLVLSVWSKYGFTWWLASAAIGGALASQVHYWSHLPPRRDSWLSAMQATGFIQSPGGHARHHRNPHNRSYCILTDWLNPWLDRAHVWARLERLFGVKSE